MSGDMASNELMEGLMRAHKWRFTVKVGDAVDVRVASGWKEARVSRVDGDRVQVRRSEDEDVEFESHHTITPSFALSPCGCGAELCCTTFKKFVA